MARLTEENTTICAGQHYDTHSVSDKLEDDWPDCGRRFYDASSATAGSKQLQRCCWMRDAPLLHHAQRL